MTNIRQLPKRRFHCISEGSGHDTVGAVALDQNGNVAFATSTGGITAKQPGRVGDSPIVGTLFFSQKVSINQDWDRTELRQQLKITFVIEDKYRTYLECRLYILS